jgi:hemerythrin-like domain-containing protein
METSGNNRHLPTEGFEKNRRDFLRKGIVLGALTGITGLGLISSCKEKDEEGVSPSEDLMREHGLLNRILLIYDFMRMRLANNEQFDQTALLNSAQIIRYFIEDYHEKLEEDFLFPRFEKANLLTELVQVLRSQHKAGRILTDRIMEFGKGKPVTDPEDSTKLAKLLADFNHMYRPHESREDTVLFPSIRKIIPSNEYFALGEDFEDREHKLFGEDGYESEVEKVAKIERELGIYELAEFTPAL